LLPTSPVDDTLNCGSLIGGSISASGEVDQITFSGTANHKYTQTLTQSGIPSGVAARATLFSPAGMSGLTFDAHSRQQLMLGETGTYIIMGLRTWW
jgi:hypothetical protein